MWLNFCYFAFRHIFKRGGNGGLSNLIHILIKLEIQREHRSEFLEVLRLWVNPSFLLVSSAVPMLREK